MKLKQADAVAALNKEDEEQSEMVLLAIASKPKSHNTTITTTARTGGNNDPTKITNKVTLLFDFHVDLVKASQNHVRFLRKLHANGTTLQRPSRRSLHRYVNCWLPLVAKIHAHATNLQQQQQLIPPSDVAWLWHCHRLAPMHYEQYVCGRFGSRVILEANPPFCSQDFHNDDNNKDDEQMIGKQHEQEEANIATFTKRAWLEMFPKEPFFLEENSSSLLDDSAYSTDDEDKNRIIKVGDFDLIGSTQRQKDFLYQISGSGLFQDVSFLQDGVNKYYQFIRLGNNNNNKDQPTSSIGTTATRSNFLPLVPTLQIDLLWHTHILSSLEMYNTDCIAIRGEKFHHDDDMDDRTPGAILDQSFQHAVQLWKEAYGEDYNNVPGARYRGKAPASYYDCRWKPAAAAAALSVESSYHGDGCGGGSCTGAASGFDGGGGCGGGGGGCGGG
jgi:Glycine-rich domain-containing protein-like